MAEEIVTQIFEMTESDIDANAEEFMEVFKLIRGKVDCEVSEKLYSVVILSLYEAKQAGFKAGWQMRAQL